MIQDSQTKDSGAGFKNFICEVLSNRFFPFFAAIVAIILTLPSLKTGLIADDYHHKLLMSG
jgi:hypothetical protein